MTEITWGPEIAVNGVRPTWLSDDTQYRPKSRASGWWAERSEEERHAGWLTWPNMTAIRLPADHFAYVAIDKGFEPWGGGDAAPDDWDGGEVLFRDGETWRQEVSWWTHGTMLSDTSDVIGYRKCTETPADTVSVPRLSLTDVSEAREAYFASISLASDDSAVFYARRWGLLREETLAERFTRETGHEPSPAVLAALAFEREA